jgi:tRNA(fMet)-specific endonuclease VapC
VECSAATRLAELDVGQAVASSITYAEVALGVMRGRDRSDRMMAFFEQVPVVPFDRAAAERYAALPFRRRSFDGLIAAHALACGAVLVTNNPSDFEHVPGLRMENWSA